MGLKDQSLSKVRAHLHGLTTNNIILLYEDQWEGSMHRPSPHVIYRERGWRWSAALRRGGFLVVVIGFRCFYESYRGALLVFVYDVCYFHLFFCGFVCWFVYNKCYMSTPHISAFCLWIRSETRINVKSEPKVVRFLSKTGQMDQ